MIKVAAVVPPASMNLGNDFFSLAYKFLLLLYKSKTVLSALNKGIFNCLAKKDLPDPISPKTAILII